MESVALGIMGKLAENLLGVNLGPAIENKVASTAASTQAYDFEASRNSARSLHGTGRMARAAEHAGAAHFTASRNFLGESRREANRGQVVRMSA